MKVVYQVVAKPHHHANVGQLARTSSGSFYWDESRVNTCDYAVLAHSRTGKLIGIQKLDLAVRGKRRCLKSSATFVWPLYRGERIAQGLWATAIRELRITHVEVKVVSDRGKTLVVTLSEQFPKVRFQMIEDGQRPLRSLKGAKGSKGSKGARQKAA